MSWKIQEISRQFPRFSKDFLVVQNSGNRTVAHAPMVESPENRTVQMDPSGARFGHKKAPHYEVKTPERKIKIYTPEFPGRLSLQLTA